MAKTQNPPAPDSAVEDPAEEQALLAALEDFDPELRRLKLNPDRINFSADNAKGQHVVIPAARARKILDGSDVPPKPAPTPEPAAE